MTLTDQAYAALLPGDRVRAYGGLYIITVPAGVDGTSAWGKELTIIHDEARFGQVRPIWRTDIRCAEPVVLGSLLTEQWGNPGMVQPGRGQF